ncbi:MAG: glycosyltransferase, partial [Chloroflexota bacterium]
MNRTRQLQRLAMLSVHTCPLALLGGKKTGGMNVYVRDLSRELGRRGILVDVFTRSQDDCQPRVKHDLGYGARVIHVPAGPEKPIPVAEVEKYLDEFVEGVVGFAAAEDLRYDLIHSHYWLSGLVAERLQQRWRRHAVEDDRVTRWQGDTEDDRVTRWQGDTEDDRVTRWQGDKVTEKDSVTPSPRH